MALSYLLLASAIPALAAPSVSVQFLGRYASTDPNTYRDLGFTGKIGNYVYSVFGDTSKCPAGVTSCPPTWANSVGIALSPTSFKDTPNSQTPRQFCEYFSDEDPATSGIGITAPVPIDATLGFLFTLPARRNLPPDGSRAYILGAGTALVTVDQKTGNPTCWRTSHTIWNGYSEPWWGDHSSFLGNNGGYVFFVGGSNSTYSGGQYLWIGRVPKDSKSITDLSKFQYWNGNNWGNARISALKQYAIKDVHGDPLQFIGQGQVKWNEYLGLYVMVYGNPDFNTGIYIRTAPVPQGPWSDAQQIYDTHPKCDSLTYGMVYDQYWYPTDQSIVVRYTCEVAFQQSLKVTFQK